MFPVLRNPQQRRRQKLIQLLHRYRRIKKIGDTYSHILVFVLTVTVCAVEIGPSLIVKRICYTIRF